MAQGDSPVHSDLVARPSRRTLWTCLVGVVMVGLAVAHWPFVLEGYGEQDAALTGITAILWAQDGRLPVESGVFVEERFRSNPLYLYALRRALEAEAVTRGGLVSFMNGLSTVAGLLIPGGVFLLLYRLRGAAEAAAATILILLAPIFFHSKCYGFPALPALLLFVGALLAFHQAVRRPGRWYVRSAPALVLLVAAVLTKVDVILLAPAFPVIPFAAPERAERKVSIVLAVVFPLAALVLWHGFCNVLSPGASGTVREYSQWNDRWPLHPAGLLYADNLLSIAMAAGMGTTVALVPAIGYGLFRRDLRPAAAAVIACVVPTLLFWGMRHAVSSRHSLWVVFPAAAFVSFVLHRSIIRTPIRVCVLAAVCAGNYFLGPTHYTGKTASARLFHSAAARERDAGRRDAAYALALRKAENRKICFYANPEPAYPAAMALRLGERCRLKRTGPVERIWLIEATIDGTGTFVWIPPRDDRSQWLWNKIFQEQWLTLTPGPGDPPLFQLFHDGTSVPWPRK